MTSYHMVPEAAEKMFQKQRRSLTARTALGYFRLKPPFHAASVWAAFSPTTMSILDAGNLWPLDAICDGSQAHDAYSRAEPEEHISDNVDIYF